MTRVDLGELGGEHHDETDVSFDYFGEAIRVDPDLTDVAVIELFASVRSARLGQVLDQIVETLVHPADHTTFRRLVREHRQTMDDLAEFARRLLEALTGRPTLRPFDSSNGPPGTDTSSGPSGSSTEVEEALRLLDGRPDLQAAVNRAARHKSEAAG